jgi:hypothetical protein
MARPKNLRRNEGRAGRVSVTGSNKRRQNDKAVQRPVGILNLAAQPDKCGHDIQAANGVLGRNVHLQGQIGHRRVVCL